MVALCTISTLIFLSSKRCEQGVLIGQEQVIGQAQNNVQSKCKTVILLGLPNEQTCIDEVVGVKWTNNKACCVFCEKNCRDSKSNRGSKVKMTFFFKSIPCFISNTCIGKSSLWFNCPVCRI